MQQIFNFLTLFRRERRPGDLVFAIAFLLLAVVLAFALPTQAKFLGDKNLVSEPGFWPSVGVAMMVFFGLIHFLGTWNAPRLPGRAAEVIIWLRSAEFVAWFVGYVFAVPMIGYLPTSLVFAVLLCLRLGYRGARALAAAAGFALVVVLVFKAGLGVRIPPGALYQYLPDSIRTFIMVNF